MDYIHRNPDIYGNMEGRKYPTRLRSRGNARRVCGLLSFCFLPQYMCREYLFSLYISLLLLPV